MLFLFILGEVLGAGVYALVGEIAGEVGGAVWLPMPVALVLALLTAAPFAELVSKYPRAAGGSAVFAQRAFRSPVISFLVGHCMLAAGVTSAAGPSLAFGGDYLSVFLDVPAVPAAVVLLVLVGLLNARGDHDHGQPAGVRDGRAGAAPPPAGLGRVLPQRRTPWVAIVVTTLVAIALTLTGDFEDLANTVVLLLLFVFLSTNIAVLVLRRDRSTPTTSASPPESPCSPWGGACCCSGSRRPPSGAGAAAARMRAWPTAPRW